MIRHGSLFSGIGGFDLAAQNMGWQNIFHCEINEFCQKVLKYYWPNADSYEDIKQTDFSIYRGKIDVLSGGFPCQPFSTAGKRKGSEDDRYLWPEMLRVIDETNPTWVVGENVAGLVSMVQPEIIEANLESQVNLQGEVDEEIVLEYQQYVIEKICSDLEYIGYSVQPIIIPACAVGAPHRRDRVWFIAHSNSIRSERKSSSSIRKDENETIWANLHEQIGGFSFQRTSSDTPSDRRNGERSESKNENGEQKSKFTRIMEGRLEGLHSSQNDSNSNGFRLRGKSNGIGKTRFTSENGPRDHWSNFPTQPPVCSGNDGISSKLDGITFPKWRSESIKAFGNAVVPKVVYEIFKAIEQQILKS